MPQQNLKILIFNSFKSMLNVPKIKMSYDFKFPFFLIDTSCVISMAEWDGGWPVLQQSGEFGVLSLILVPAVWVLIHPS